MVSVQLQPSYNFKSAIGSALLSLPYDIALCILIYFQMENYFEVLYVTQQYSSRLVTLLSISQELFHLYEF